MTDHGAESLFAFPNDYLYADELNATLEYMYNNKMYKNLVIYIESCESGSMLMNLATDKNIYGLTASTPYESSYACYYSYSRETYLGDCFSVNWLQNSMPMRIKLETLYDQYEIDKNKTTTSTVCKYGDTSMDNMPLQDFLEYDNKTSIPTLDTFNEIAKTSADSRDVVLDVLMHKYSNANTQAKKDMLINEIEIEMKSRQFYDEYFGKYEHDNKENTCNGPKIDYECLRREVNRFEKMYGKFTDYGMKYISRLAKICLL